MRLECVILSICLASAVHSLNSWYNHIYHNVIFLKTSHSVKSHNENNRAVGKIGLRLDYLKPWDFVTRTLTKQGQSKY